MEANDNAVMIPSRASGVMISYKELVQIRTEMATLNAKLDAALALRGDVDLLKERMREVELRLATASGQAEGGGTVMKLVWQGLWGLAAAIIGALGSKYLPY